MERGNLHRDAFMQEIARMTQTIVKRAKEYDSDTIPGDYATLETPCPNCGAQVKENYRRFACTKCEFSISKIPGGRQFEIPEVEELLREKTIGPLSGFRSKMGRPFSAILKLAGVEGGLENNLFRGRARVFEGEQSLLDALDRTPETFQNHDMIIVRYEGPSGAPGMPEMLDPTSRITTLCRERGIVVALMTDARFSGGSVGLVIGHVGPEAALGGPIALIEEGDEIVADLNKDELNCTALSDPAVRARRQAAWDKVVADNGGIHPNCGAADTRLLRRARLSAVPATRGGGLHPNREVWVRNPRTAERSGFVLRNRHRPDANRTF